MFLEFLKDYRLKDCLLKEICGFIKGKSFLICLVVFYDGMIPPMGKGRTTGVIHLGCCEPLDMVPCNILLCKLDRDGFDSWTLKWIRNVLGGHIQGVMVNGSDGHEWEVVTPGVHNRAISDI
ncbi:hypothetical protein HGM15179_009647 [Zosterops borbonicus]|uniref:Uncharacterized protein n=1 Tax=Zosterops borbonicus TaxID=364589 RepID=A0A8K1LKL9_9PASS|nr:hypothetical protein HGM15179_009647 [Zosterops borbonicus]